MVEFTDHEKWMIYDAVKQHRHASEEYYDLYEKVGEWYSNDD
jgi:hypothetical protein